MGNMLQFQHMADYAPALLWITDKENNCTYLNHSWYNFTGTPPETCYGLDWLDILHPDDRQFVLDNFLTATSKRKPFKAEYRLKRADGQFCWVLGIGQPYYAEGGEYKGYVGSIIDIDDRKHAEQKIIEQRTHLEAIYQAINDGIWVFNMQDQTVLVNDALAFILGYPDTESLKHDLENLTQIFEISELDGTVLPPEAWPACCVMHGQSFSHHEFVVRKHDDSQKKVISFSGQPIYDSEGNQILALLVIRDITQRKQVEEELRKSENFNRSLIEGSADCIKLLDCEGNLMFINHLGMEILELEESDIELGKEWATFCPTEMYETTRNAVKSAAEGNFVRYQGFCATPKGTPKWWDTQISPIRNPEGKVSHLLAVSRDITHAKQTEEALYQAKLAAEAANKAKSEFLANMSHEIRTPMNAVVGLSNVLNRDASLSAPQKEIAATLQLSAQSLMMLINDLLDIAKIETSEITLEQVPFRLNEILDDVLHMFQLSAQEKGLIIELVTSENANMEFLGDPQRIKQILLNLVSNAIKFTQNGTITIKVTAIPHTNPEQRNVTISVADTGMGIPEDKLEAIFEKFTQADPAITRIYGGTGLGLAISRSLAKLMEGDITVTSALGKGSEFTLHLPLTCDGNVYRHSDKSTPEKETPKEQDTHSRPTVLLVEDYEPNILVASLVLDHLGYDHDVAKDGYGALDKIHTHHDQYCGVLMDVQMPKMDGLEATRIIRKEEKANNQNPVPIIAMTAFAMKEDKERCLEAGMDGYISKPFNPEELSELMKKFCFNNPKNSLVDS